MVETMDPGVNLSSGRSVEAFVAALLNGEYRLAAHTFGRGTAELAGLARRAVHASFLDETAKQALVAEIDAMA